MNNKFYRLTVHVTDVQKVDAQTGRRIKTAKGTNPEKKDKFGEELINISFVK